MYLEWVERIRRQLLQVLRCSINQWMKVRQEIMQEFFYEERYHATPMLAPDFCRVAAAYDIPAIRVSRRDDAQDAIEKHLAPERERELRRRQLAIKSLETSIANDPLPAQIDLASGLAAFEAKHFSRAVQLLSPLADAGNSEAQHRVAIMYQNGLGVARTPEVALRWMRAAAEAGNPLAQHGLGFMYMNGECVDRDDAAAVVWFRRAAEQGLEGSMAMLATLYEQGRGVKQDLEAAREWYRRAGFDQG